MKSLSFFVAVLLIASSIAAIGIGEEAGDLSSGKLDFAEPIIKKSSIDTFLEIDVEGANARLHHQGKPILPIYTETYSFKFGTKIIDIKCEPEEVQTIILKDKIIPAPKPMISDTVLKTPE